jgi:phosphoribosylformylglycinamidine (FGAM) synthase-like enzyme
VGVEVDLPESGAARHGVMFGEGPSRIVVSVPPDAERSFERLMAESSAPWRWIGQVGGDRLIIRSGGASAIDLALEQGAQAWRSGFAQYVS